MLMKIKSTIDISDININKRKDLHIYSQLIGKLIYLVHEIRLKVAFIVGHLSKHNTDLLQNHYFWATKRVIWYLKDTINLKLIYNWITIRNSPPYDLSNYIDNNFTGYPEDYKLIIGYCFFLMEL